MQVIRTSFPAINELVDISSVVSNNVLINFFALYVHAVLLGQLPPPSTPPPPPPPPPRTTMSGGGDNNGGGNNGGDNNGGGNNADPSLGLVVGIPVTGGVVILSLITVLIVVCLCIKFKMW